MKNTMRRGIKYNTLNIIRYAKTESYTVIINGHADYI